MKKLICIFMVVITLAAGGCGSPVSTSTEKDLFTDPIPTNIDLKDFAFTFDGYTVAEYEDSEGYKTVIDIKIVFDKSVSEQDINSITKEDLDIYVGMSGENDKPDLAETFGGKLDNIKLKPTYAIYGNVVYYDYAMQNAGTYSVENTELTIGFNYYDGKDINNIFFRSRVTSDVMTKIKQSGDITIGDSAQKYMDDKSLIIGA